MNRRVVLTGSFQYVVPDTANWDPKAEGTEMKYIDDDIYMITIENIPAGEHEYKIAIGSWGENYGTGGVRNGQNMHLILYRNTNVTFFYCDKAHFFTDSTKMIPYIGEKKPKLLLNDEMHILNDYEFTGVYKTKINVKAGFYKDITLKVSDKDILIPNLELTEDKEVSFYYDLLSGLFYTDIVKRTIDLDSIYYNSKDLYYKKPFGAVSENSLITFTLKTLKNNVEKVRIVMIEDRESNYYDMNKVLAEGEYDYWQCELSIAEKGIYKYYFAITNYGLIKFYGDNDGYLGEGICSDLKNIKPYYITIYDKNYKTPDWMNNAIVYQIFPDRFYNGSENKDNVQKTSRGFAKYLFYNDWYMPPYNPNVENSTDNNISGEEIWNNDIYGGDLKGVELKLDYLQALGINTIYLNPISKSISSHRYDTTYYKEVDPLLGNIEDFEHLAEEAHNRGMHIILDGVFNHVSDDSIYFDKFGKYICEDIPLGAYQYWSKVFDMMKERHISKEEAESHVQEFFIAQGITDFHYKDWFKIENRKVNGYYYYEGWYGYDSMPVINNLYGSEYKISSWAKEIIDGRDANSKFWLKKGANGWRLDAAEQMSDDTWRHFRRAVKGTGCDYAIIGEIWIDSTKYLLGDMYDSVTNYRFTNAVLGFISGRDMGNREIDGYDTVNMLELIREQYPEEAFNSLLNLVDSHDTQRAISAMDGYKKGDKVIAMNPSERAIKLMKLLALFQMTYPGVPCIYYGDEAGLPGGDDPDNRRAFPWGKGSKELVEWYALLANIRNKYDVFRNGYLKWIYVNKDFLIFARYNGKEQVVILLNRDRELKEYSLDVSNAIFCCEKITDAISGEEYVINNGKITIDIKDVWGTILVTDYKKVSTDYEHLQDAYSPEFIIEKRG